jgi:hypothetical protein
MKHFICAFAAAATIAAGVMLIPALSGQVEASEPQVAAKADRLDYRPFGKECSQRAWPYIGTNCLRNTVSARREVKSVRLVTTDRI